MLKYIPALIPHALLLLPPTHSDITTLTLNPRHTPPIRLTLHTALRATHGIAAHRDAHAAKVASALHEWPYGTALGCLSVALPL